MTSAERFEAIVQRGDPQSCWIWPRTITDKGYGQFYTGQEPRLVAAHRFAYELWRGPIPVGATIDHLCRNRACVNPGHLEAVPNRENVLRGVGLTAQNAAKTHCKHGHEFTPENTYLVMRDGTRRRYCKRCSADATARYIRKHGRGH